MKTLFLALLTSCAVIDAVDGDIESSENCCIKLSKSSIRSCVASFVEDGHCGTWRCPTSDGAVCRRITGEVIIPPKNFCTNLPDIPDEWCEGGEDTW